ncbi:MAG: hypothetical protein ICV68_03120 [Pyrinomonadaceae bacterium]|nr:hypothetical protein [Pyrinomonadaceae bacterium]
MKICPTCQSTYADDSLTYCLSDGAILSALRDPHETLRIPAAQNTDPAPTEVLYPARRSSSQAPTLQPTIPASPQPFYPEPQRSQAPLKRRRSTGLILGAGVLLGIALAVAMAVSFNWLGKNDATDNRSQSNNSNTVGAKISNTNQGPTSTPTITLTTLPGERWQECETYASEICGEWSRSSDEQWRGQWGGVQANLTITVSGKYVTVKRRDLTQTTEATYHGTLNADNTQITGTVKWCCDYLGDRSGTWRAKLSTSLR